MNGTSVEYVERIISALAADDDDAGSLFISSHELLLYCIGTRI